MEYNQNLTSSQFLFLSYSYWISQLIIAIIRYIFVMYPIEVHNRMPDNESKNKLFKRILK